MDISNHIVKVHHEHNDHDVGKNIFLNAFAGALAGCTEYFVMFPLDSVKTRMQTLDSSGKVYKGTWSTARTMVSQEGFRSFYRGFVTVPVGTGVSHAVYFTTYEVVKLLMIPTATSPYYSHMVHAIAGAAAALTNDAVRTPADAVKQRLQIKNSPYKSATDCIRRTLADEGPGAFYRSYTTQVAMNIPRQSIYITLYEYLKAFTNPSGAYSVGSHVVSSALAAGVAAALTTPLDVCKTVLNTQDKAALNASGGKEIKGLFQAIAVVYRIGGSEAFFKGIVPRVLFQMPSTVICWSSYEFYKYFLRIVHES